MLHYVFLNNGKLTFVCAILQSCRKMKNKLVRSINCRFSELARFDFEPLAMDKRWKRFLVVVFCLLFDVNSILDQQTNSLWFSTQPQQINFLVSEEFEFYSPTNILRLLSAFIIQISYTVRIPIFWLVDLYHATLGCAETSSSTSLSWCNSRGVNSIQHCHYTMTTPCSVFHLNNKNVNALIVRELSEFICTL